MEYFLTSRLVVCCLSQLSTPKLDCVVMLRHLSHVHTSNNVEATFDFVETTFDFIAANSNNVERVYRKISSFRQNRNNLNMFNLFRLCCQKDEISFDIVAKKAATVLKKHSTLLK